MVSDSLLQAVSSAIDNRVIPAFPTKKAAIEEGKKYGWRSAIKIKRRFETVWIVGKKDFQPSYILDIQYDNYRLPLLKWKQNDAGIQFCPIVEIQIKSYT